MVDNGCIEEPGLVFAESRRCPINMYLVLRVTESKIRRRMWMTEMLLETMDVILTCSNLEIHGNTSTSLSQIVQ